MILGMAVALVILIPLVFTFGLRPRDLPVSLPDSPHLYLESHKRRIYEGLRDLQFEYRVGKLSDHDHQQSKRELQQELAKVLQEMNRTASQAVLPETGGSSSEAPLLLVCPHCQKPWSPSMKFCGDCGKSLP